MNGIEPKKMAKRLVEFSLEGENPILVEVEEPLANEWDDNLVALPGQQVVIKAQKTFADALENIKPVAATIISKVRGLSDPPDEVEVKFGVKMTAEAGAVIAIASVEGNYEITLKWKRE